LACFSARLSGVTVSEDFRVELRFTQDSEVKIIQIDPDPVGLDRPLDEICVSYHDPAAPDPCLVSIGSPSDLQAKGRVGRVALAWTESSETYGRTVELTYEIYRSVTGEADSFSLIGTTSEPKFVDRGLGSGQQLWYFVAAVDAQGNRSAGSDTATARTR
jgi:hypothetical protein